MTRVLTSTLALLLSACASEAPLASHDAVAAKADKEDICHVDEYTGEWHPISVSMSAVESHLYNHGDWLVMADETCGDGVDNDCDGVIDEGCCPCNDMWGEAMDMVGDYIDEAVCWYSVEGPGPLEWTDAVAIEGYGYDTYFFGQMYTVDWGEYYEEMLGDYGCAFVYQYIDEDGVYYEDGMGYAISEVDHAACKVDLFATASSLGLECIDAGS